MRFLSNGTTSLSPKSPSKTATVLRWPLTSTEYQVLKGMLYHHLSRHPHGMVLNSISTASLIIHVYFESGIFRAMEDI